MYPAHGICIHAHFYQPPREDPWLDAVLQDPTAAPYHDWNTCVYEQCYKPNRAARLLDDQGRIAHITNNYRHISFNVGPTLHSWLERHDPVLSRYIVEADEKSASSQGAGGAIAQAYNHMILPLASDRDIRTQVVWGVRDFEHRFGRAPRGMWLPETAVDTRSLEALAEAGIEFTILAPQQCAAVRAPDGTWCETPGGYGLDVTRPYVMNLPSGRRIVLVFYYGSIAHDIAFGGLLHNGDAFAESLLAKLPRDSEPRLLTIATDGETYGHHHRYGEMALARAAQHLFDSQAAVLTNIPSFLDRYPATWSCRIAENTAWSCAHGVERWRSDCGCHTGGGHGWHQKWRGPLRAALDNIRDRIDEIYEREMRAYCDDPWGLRDEAIGLYLMQFSADDSTRRIAERKRDFLKDRCGNLKTPDLRRALSLIEAARMRMFMYTSCGWFFSDISGIEGKQILSYALRATEYIRELSGTDLAPDFLRDLEYAEGNTEEYPTGRDVMERRVIPNKRTVHDVAASAMLMGETERYYSYRIDTDTARYPSGEFTLSVRDISLVDTRTLEAWQGASAQLSTGGLDEVCRLSDGPAPDREELWSHFYAGDILSLSSYIERRFELGPWRFRDLTLGDRIRISQSRTKGAEKNHLDHAKDLLRDNQRLLVQLHLMRVSSSPFLESAGQFVFTNRIEALIGETPKILDLLKKGSKLETTLQEAHSMGISPDLSSLAPGIEGAFRDILVWAQEHNNGEVGIDALNLWQRVLDLRIGIDKWRLQNRMWYILEEHRGKLSETTRGFARLLNFAVPAGK